MILSVGWITIRHFLSLSKCIIITIFGKIQGKSAPDLVWKRQSHVWCATSLSLLIFIKTTSAERQYTVVWGGGNRIRERLHQSILTLDMTKTRYRLHKKRHSTSASLHLTSFWYLQWKLDSCYWLSSFHVKPVRSFSSLVCKFQLSTMSRKRP